ncbi:MAG TPA: hypothetical protein VEY71_03920 [Chitinophagales bacterium]|nr:hypothetical protein [Chitinophagales bacterium]
MRCAALLMFALFVCACERDGDGTQGGEFAGPVHDATLKLSVMHVGGSAGSPVVTSVQNATITLHQSYGDAVSATNPLREANTGTAGSVQFNGLELNEHFIRAAHPAYGFSIDSVNTPAHSTTIWEVWL